MKKHFEILNYNGFITWELEEGKLIGTLYWNYADMNDNVKYTSQLEDISMIDSVKAQARDILERKFNHQYL